MHYFYKTVLLVLTRTPIRLKNMAVAIDTNSLVALRATKLLLTPTQSRDDILITAQYR